MVAPFIFGGDYMSSIREPDGQIILYKNIPLDPTYEHTIYWTSSTDGTGIYASEKQYNYFIGSQAHRVLSLQNQSYTRVSKGKIRILVGNESTTPPKSILKDVMECNYMAFKNTAFDPNKWFYAFVTKVEYINNNVCEVDFELDVMQTWMFDYTLGKCFVEREHAASDALFANTVPENVELGDTYITRYKHKESLRPNWLVILHGHINEPIISNWGSIKNGIYVGGLAVTTFDLTNPNMAELNTAIKNIGTDNIVAMYQVPFDFLPRSSGYGSLHIDVPSEQDPRNNRTIGSYTVKNNKLLCYPYNFLTVSNNAGQVAEYHFENFSTNPTTLHQFYIDGVSVTQCVGICYPIDYCNEQYNIDSGITISNFPVCGWTGNVFEEWWAHNRNSFITGNMTAAITSLLGGGAGIAAGIGTGSAPTAVSGAMGVFNTASTIANSIAKVQDIKSAPPQFRGQTQTDCLNSYLDRYGFTLRRLSIKEEYARIIDDYFFRYGYATKRNKIPNRNVRERFTYTKTLDCNITSNTIPNDDIVKICSIYNNGITFWRNADNVGNYGAADYTNPPA